MKFYLAAALALGLAFAPAAPAYAEQATQFRTVAPQSFSAADLQRYGLGEADIAKVRSYQAQGYEVVALTPEQARQIAAGHSSEDHGHLWIIVALAAVVIAVVVAVE
jgi:hypothetical protein